MNENMVQATRLITELVQTNMERFVKHSFLSPQWWLLLSFIIIPWLIWTRVVDKKRKLEIVVVGLLATIITKLLDLVGYNLRFWDYPYQIIPLVPEAFSFDLSMIPVAYMLLYQYFKTWKTYCIGLVCLSIIYSFIGEPLSNLLMLVVYIKWKYYYSTVYYIVLGIFVKAVVENLKGTHKEIPFSPINK